MVLLQENAIPVIASIFFLFITAVYILLVPPNRKEKNRFALFAVAISAWLTAYTFSSNTTDANTAAFIHRYVQIPSVALTIHSLLSLIYHFPRRLSIRWLDVIMLIATGLSYTVIVLSFLPESAITFSTRVLSEHDTFVIAYPDLKGKLFFIMYLLFSYFVVGATAYKKVRLFQEQERKASIFIFWGIAVSMGWALLVAVLLPAVGISAYSGFSPVAAPILVFFFAYAIINYDLMKMSFSRKLTIVGFFILTISFMLFTYAGAVSIRANGYMQMEMSAFSFAQAHPDNENHMPTGVVKLETLPGLPQHTNLRSVMYQGQVHYVADVAAEDGRTRRLFFDRIPLRTTIHRYILVSLNILLAASGLYFLLAPYMWKAGFINPIRHLTHLAESIASGSSTGNSQSTDEFGELAESLHAALEKMKLVKAEEEEQSRLKSELELARTIQVQSFPRNGRYGMLTVHSLNNPSEIVSGDFYDVFEKDNLTFFYLADVSGKSYSAALYTVMLRSLLRISTNMHTSPGYILRNINDILLASSQAGMFFTIFLGVFDRDKKELKYSSGGHWPQVLVKGNGGLEVLQTQGPPLGIKGGRTFETKKIVLSQGDTVFLYSDGLSEAENVKVEQFGEERIFQFLKITRTLSVERVVDLMAGEVIRFTEKTIPADDLTMLAVRLNDENVLLA